MFPREHEFTALVMDCGPRRYLAAVSLRGESNNLESRIECVSGMYFLGLDRFRTIVSRDGKLYWGDREGMRKMAGGCVQPVASGLRIERGGGEQSFDGQYRAHQHVPSWRAQLSTSAAER